MLNQSSARLLGTLGSCYAASFVWNLKLTAKRIYSLDSEMVADARQIRVLTRWFHEGGKFQESVRPPKRYGCGRLKMASR